MRNRENGGADLADRHPDNALIHPGMIVPSREDFVVECVLNPAAFEFQGRTGLLLRVAERPAQEHGWISTPVIGRDGRVEILRFRSGDPEVDASDPRLIRHRNTTYLTTLSHLRAAWSATGSGFSIEETPTLAGAGPQEAYGIEDARVVKLDSGYFLTYTAVSSLGHGVGMISTQDWQTFERHGMILPPPNKDCAIFGEKTGNDFWMLHRPTTSDFAGNCIWSAVSEDLLHWTDHRFVAAPRPGMWDEGRIGPGAAPIKTESGWLEIYHGATFDHRYCLGALLLDLENPSTVLARSQAPIMEPLADYERLGFLGSVVFTNGHIVSGDRITLYYGAADRVVCSAELSLKEILATLQ